MDEYETWLSQQGIGDEPEILCDRCKINEPECGADQCTGCLVLILAAEGRSDEIVTNSTSAYLRAHADIEHDPTPVLLCTPAAEFNNVAIGPYSSPGEIARTCASLSTPSEVVSAEISSIAGQSVITLVRKPAPQGLEALLRAGSELPLSSSAPIPPRRRFRRQAG